jgi:uncharacterized protein DUF6011
MPFETETIPSLPFLAELREEVLKHSLKRMPKWKFRFAPDIVVQLQPKPTMLPSEVAMARGIKPKFHLFEGIAVMAEGVTVASLKNPLVKPCPPWWQIKFELFASDPETDWAFHRTGGRWHVSADRSEIATLVQRIVAILRSGFFTESMPAQMLSHSCVICGKALTDPASMARWIGPECAGTSTLHVPFVIAPQFNEAAA